MTYAALLILAVFLCRAELEALALAVLVGASYYLPVELIRDRDVWYATCIFAEMTVAVSALFLSTRSSLPVAYICMMLITGHILDWNHQSGQVYYIIANYLEYLEIISCIIFSPSLLNLLRKKISYAISRNR